MTRAVVVGAGMAGLVAAAYLAKDGFDVDVYEQSDAIGGVTRTIERNGYKWDIGPMILETLAPDEPGGQVLRELGCADKIELIPGDRGVVFPDYKILKPEKYGGPLWRKEKLKEIFPDEADGIDGFYKVCDIVTDLVTLDRRKTVSGPVRSFFLKIAMIILYLRIKKYEKWSAKDMMDHFFKDEKIKIFFTAILADLVVMPSEFIGLGVPFFNPELAYDHRIPRKRVFGIGPKSVGFYYVKGGVGKIVEALSEVIGENGGRIHTKSPVKRVLTEGDRVSGVEIEGGKKVEAPLVFVSGDARESLIKLIGREKLPPDFAKKIDDITLMESVFMVQLGVDMDPRPYQDRPVVYYINIYDLEHGVSKLRDGEYHEGKEGFVIYINSYPSPEMAPEGKHSITIYTVAPSNLEGGWEERRQEMTDKLMDEAEKVIPNLRKNAKVIFSLTPDDFKKITNMPDHHSFGGMCPVMGKDPAPHKTPFKGLWFVGSQSESGAGVWNQLLGSRKAFKKARKYVR